MPSLNKTIAQLSHLISACLEGQMIYRDCAQRAASEANRIVFESLAMRLSVLANQATEHISEYGGLAHPHISLGGSLKFGWQHLKASLGQVSDNELLVTGLRVEPLIREQFQTLLDQDLDPGFRQQLIDRYEAWLFQHNQLSALAKH